MSEIATVDEGTSLLAVIARAASDPNVDVVKMDRLLQMQERILARQAEGEFNDAMNAAQAEMGPIAATSRNKQTSSNYAGYDALDKVVRPIYTKHGFSLSFNGGEGAPADHVRVECYVSAHGHTRTYRVDMPADGKGAKGGDVMTKTHAAGSAFTYGQRYLLGLIFNLSITGKRDDDGNAAGGGFITDAQAEELKTLISAAVATRPGTNEADWITDFLAWLKVDALNVIPVKQFNKAKAAIIDATKSGAK